MKLLLLNDSYFGDTLQRPDVEILRVGPGSGNDVVIDPLRKTIPDVLAETGFEPDVILQVDSIDERVFFRGLETIDAPRVFYAIDSPINEFWQIDWAHNFDLVFVDQRSTEQKMLKLGVDWVEWLPLAADTSIYHEPLHGRERDIDIAFVGTIDADRRPRRSAILYRLNQVADVTVIDGDGKRSVPPLEVAELYRRAKLVLNEALFDGVNLRTFEAMACGAVVLTEENRGAEDLFADLPVMATFNAESLEKTVAQLLANPVDRREMGREGASVIRDSHTVELRAQHVLNRLDELKVRTERNTPASRANIAWGMLQASLKWEPLKAWGVEAMRDLAAYVDQLPVLRWAQMLEISGKASQALEVLVDANLRGMLGEKEQLALAGLSLDLNQDEIAGEVLGLLGASKADLHIAIGNRLYGLGHDLDPGLNRTAGPATAWNAFEHFRRAQTLDSDNLGGLEGMDRVLMKHHGAEFLLPLWQQWHARHPRDPESMRKVMQRIKGSYFSPRPLSAEGRGTAVPFEPNYPRSGDRTPSRGLPRRST